MQSRSYMPEFLERLRRFLSTEVACNKRVTVGLSGGVDSMVLLDCLWRLRDTLNIDLSAVHIHHGLSSNADRWAEFCSVQTRARTVPLRVVRVEIRRDDGISLEAEARKARISAFAELDTDFLALGHHLDDQVETLMLQLLRGAGPKGLSSMAPSRMFVSNMKLLRPLLDVVRADIVAYAREAGLSWVEDESNLDMRFDRNFLRSQVFPALAIRFPGYRTSLSRSARNMADLDEVAAAMGRQDLAAISIRQRISVTGLRALSTARALNALRCVIEELGKDMPPRSRLMELLRQATTSKAGAGVQVDLNGLCGRVYRDELVFTCPDNGSRLWSVPWRGADRTWLPSQNGWVNMQHVTGRGLRLDMLKRDLLLRNRSGGERLRVHLKQPRKTLTHLFQVAGVPPWDRARMPILCSGEEILWVPELGYAAEYIAAPHADGFELAWIDSDAMHVA